MKKILFILPILAIASESNIRFLGNENGMSKHELVCKSGQKAIILINEKNRDTYLLQNGTKVYYGKNALMKIEKELCE
jgi:hypothetical protein